MACATLEILKPEICNFKIFVGQKGCEYILVLTDTPLFYHSVTTPRHFCPWRSWLGTLLRNCSNSFFIFFSSSLVSYCWYYSFLISTFFDICLVDSSKNFHLWHQQPWNFSNRMFRITFIAGLQQIHVKYVINSNFISWPVICFKIFYWKY